jgi:tripeptide aminopeptidase
LVSIDFFNGGKIGGHPGAQNSLKTETQMVDRVELLENLLRLPGKSGEEHVVSEYIQKTCQKWGISQSHIQVDDAPSRISLPCSTGNLFVRLPGNRPGPTILISSHMDTVPPCVGAVPLRMGNKIVPEGKTALGGDNRTGVAAMLTLIHAIQNKDFPHPPLVFLFSIREESGLQGARFLNPNWIKHCAFGINIDGGSCVDATRAAVGANRFVVEIIGKASHAGVYPEKGISAVMVAGLALEKIHRGGWFGKVVKGNNTGSSNIGVLSDASGGPVGQATNVVTDFVRVKGECRSMDTHFVEEITQAHKNAFEEAALQIRDIEGNPAEVIFETQKEYRPFSLPADCPVIPLFEEAVRALGKTPTLKNGRGGLDANWFFEHGVPSLTIGAGQNQIHAIGEWVDLDQYQGACDLLEIMIAKAAG